MSPNTNLFVSLHVFGTGMVVVLPFPMNEYRIDESRSVFDYCTQKKIVRRWTFPVRLIYCFGPSYVFSLVSSELFDSDITRKKLKACTCSLAKKVRKTLCRKRVKLEKRITCWWGNY